MGDVGVGERPEVLAGRDEDRGREWEYPAEDGGSGWRGSGDVREGRYVYSGHEAYCVGLALFWLLREAYEYGCSGHVGEVTSAAWHPKETTTFITSSADSTIRCAIIGPSHALSKSVIESGAARTGGGKRR